MENCNDEYGDLDIDDVMLDHEQILPNDMYLYFCLRNERARPRECGLYLYDRILRTSWQGYHWHCVWNFWVLYFDALRSFLPVRVQRHELRFVIRFVFKYWKFHWSPVSRWKSLMAFKSSKSWRGQLSTSSHIQGQRDSSFKWGYSLRFW